MLQDEIIQFSCILDPMWIQCCGNVVMQDDLVTILRQYCGNPGSKIQDYRRISSIAAGLPQGYLAAWEAPPKNLDDILAYDSFLESK